MAMKLECNLIKLMKCIRLLSIFAWKFATNMFCQKKSPRKHQIPRDRRALMRKRSKLQMKTQRSTNHQTKENVLNQIKKIEKNVKISINTERNLRETRAIAAIKNNPKYFYKFVKKQLIDQSWNWTSPG